MTNMTHEKTLWPWLNETEDSMKSNAFVNLKISMKF